MLFQHLEDVNEDYVTHLKSALTISKRMIKGAVCVFIHAFLPCVFTNTASTICNEIVVEVNAKKIHKE